MGSGYPFLFWLAVIAAFFTAFYMFRLVLHGVYGRIPQRREGCAGVTGVL